jgi:site-specific DNA-methyltransferase (cytosine-N4-specific)
VPKKSDIPFAGDFSPNEVELGDVLGWAKRHPGDRKGLQAEILAAYYAHRGASEKSKQTLAYNVSLGMAKYGLIEPDGTLTPLGEELLAFAEAGEEAAMYRRFAQHILVEMPGTALLRCVQDMQRAGEPVTLITLRDALLERGIHTPSANKHISLMRLWLDKAGVTTSAWRINQALLDKLLGLADDEVEALASMTPAQAAVARTLAALGEEVVDSSKLRVAAERAHGIRINEKQMPKDVLIPLRDLGYVEFQSGSARSAPVKATEKLTADVVVPLLEQLAGALPVKLLELLRLPLAGIVAELDGNTYEKGLALEALAFKILRLAGLRYRDTRYRPQRGGRFEVDLLFDSRTLAYSRWQVQCKNTSAVSLDDVAKEVGLTYYLLSSVIAVITRGTVGAEARRYAIDVMRKTNLAVVLIDGDDIDRIVSDPLYVFDVLRREADFAMQLKPLSPDELMPADG